MEQIRLDVGAAALMFVSSQVSDIEMNRTFSHSVFPESLLCLPSFLVGPHVHLC